MEIIHVVCNIDDGYVKHCIVMLTSLFVNNERADFHVHVIADILSEDSRKMLSETVEHRFGGRLSFYLVGKGLVSMCPIDPQSHISISTYYRCFLTTILPSSLSKVLYLDCDLIVNGSIAGLWNIDLDGYAVGVVEDMWSGKADNYSRLHYPQEYSYFNAGVLLINLDYWRKQQVEMEITDYIRRYPDRLLFNDQDVLNGVLYNRKLFIPFRWNMQDGFFRRKRKLRAESLPALEAEMCQAVIIHYTGSKKPWQYKSQHPYKNLYFRYLDLTPWKGNRPVAPFSYRLKRAVDYVLYFVHFAQPRYRKCKPL